MGVARWRGRRGVRGEHVAAAPRLGALTLFAAVIFGQLVCSVLLDHFGVLYRELGLSTGRIAGVIVLGAGVAMVRFF